MSVQLRLRRGTRADHDAFTGAEGEITYVTDEKSLRVHDGATSGGHTVAGGFPDAPVDGKEYLRKDGTWVQPSAGGVSDAPVDGRLYGRQDGAWVEVVDDGTTAATTSYDNSASDLAATDVQAAIDELDAAKIDDAPSDGQAYVRVDGTWEVDSQATPTIIVRDEGTQITPSVASLDFTGGGVTATDDGSGNVEVTVTADGGTAAGTTYDNATSGLAATDVQVALDELAARSGAPVMAIIAGAGASDDVKDATDYVEGTANIETVVAQALADGYRSLLFVDVCTATAAVDITVPGAVDLYGAPGASLAGDLTISASGARVKLDVPITGTITDTNGRLTRPTYDGPTSDPSAVTGADAITNIISLTQAEYDAIGTPDASTIYVITDAT